MLSLIDYLDQAVFEGLMQSDLISQANFVCVPLSEPPTSLLPPIRPGFTAKSTPWQLVERACTHISMTIFPKPYHKPPAPTSEDSRTLFASALSAFLTFAANGVGITGTAHSLGMIDWDGCKLMKREGVLTSIT